MNAKRVHRRNLVASGLGDYRRSMNNQKSVRLDNETSAGLTTQRGYDFFDVAIVVNRCCDWLDCERRSGGLEWTLEIQSAARSRLGVKHNRHPLHAGRDLFQQLKPLACHRRLDVDKPGDISPGARKACHKACTDRI